jgi:hypothetical protein
MDSRSMARDSRSFELLEGSSDGGRFRPLSGAWRVFKSTLGTREAKIGYR